MFIIMNRASLVVAVTSAVKYVRVASNGLPVVTTPEEAEAIYSADTDAFYPLSASAVWSGGGYRVEEVATVPDEVVPGFYYFGGGTFYTTPEREAETAAVEAQKAAPAVASIVFVSLAEEGKIDDVTATENASQFAEWAYPIDYKVGAIRRAGGLLYRCIQAHTSQSDWTPAAAASLWTSIADPAEEWPAWAQPVGAHDAYAIGAKVTHNGQHWKSTAAANVWEPGVYGWEVASA